MQGWQDRCKEMQYSRRKPCSLVEALGITFKAMGVPADHPYFTLAIIITVHAHLLCLTKEELHIFMTTSVILYWYYVFSVIII